MISKLDTYNILKQYTNGDLDKYEAMDALGLDTVYDLFALMKTHNLLSAAGTPVQQSPEHAQPLAEFFGDV